MVEVTDTARRVRRVIQMSLGVMPEETKDDARLLEDLGADSLDCIEIAMSLEDEFGVSLTDDDAAAMMTVGGAVRLIEKLRGGEGA
jgi:acyl carrier protein